MKAEDFDTVFYVAARSMWDLAESPASIALIESFYNSGKPVALVCHSPGVLHHVMYNGAPLVKGKRVTGFTNEEEEEVHLTKVVPFLVEDELKRLGAIFEKCQNCSLSRLLMAVSSQAKTCVVHVRGSAPS